MQIKGEEKCYICGETIKWWSSIRDGNNMEEWCNQTYVREAEIVAIGRLATTEGNRVRFEVKVNCPHCKNCNKFEATESAPRFIK